MEMVVSSDGNFLCLSLIIFELDDWILPLFDQTFIAY